MLKRFTIGAAVLLLPLSPMVASEPDPTPESAWVLTTLKDSLAVTDGDTLSLRHAWGDVRLETAETDRIQVTAVAQHHSDDPRLPAIRFAAPAPGSARGHRVLVDFAGLEVAEKAAWTKRRIDVGILIPVGIAVEIETTQGLIEAKDVRQQATLTSTNGEITYQGTGDLVAHSQRGAIRAILKRTDNEHRVTLSSLTSDITCTILEGANAQVEVTTRGPITTDFTIEIERQTGSPLKSGRARIGAGGSSVRLESHSGTIRLQGLIAPQGP